MFRKGFWINLFSHCRGLRYYCRSSNMTRIWVLMWQTINCIWRTYWIGHLWPIRYNKFWPVHLERMDMIRFRQLRVCCPQPWELVSTRKITEVASTRSQWETLRPTLAVSEDWFTFPLINLDTVYRPTAGESLQGREEYRLYSIAMVLKLLEGIRTGIIFT